MSDQAKRPRPCDACRRRKTKCVTEDGSSICVLCKFHAQICTHDEAPKSRKRPQSSIDQVGDLPGAKRSRTMVTTTGTGIEEYDTHEGPTLLKRTLGLQNLHHSQYIGFNAVLDTQCCGPRLGGAQPATQESNRTPMKVRFVHPLHAFTVVPDAGTPGYDRENVLLDEVQEAVGGHGPELVRLYFRIVHPSFPILHKEVFLEKYARTYREFSPPCLAAVYLLASEYWTFSKALKSIVKPDFSKLKQLARSSLQIAIDRPKLSTVQAALMTAQHQATNPGTGERPLGLMTRQLVDLAYGLGLHLDPSDWDIPRWEKGLRRRLSWAIYLQDTWTALLTGRPLMMSSDAWDVEPLTDADFPETAEEEEAGSSEVEKGRLVFIHMSKLTVTLHAILRSVFSSRFQRSLYSAVDKLSLLLDLIKPLQLRLKSWFAALPESLKMETAAAMKLSSVGYLRLAYLTVEVCIHRQLIKALSETEMFDHALAAICRTAATERFNNTVEFVQRLQAPHLASFWYFPSAQCCVMIYHFGRALKSITSQVHERASLDQKLNEYTWTLTVNSEAGAGFLKHALVSIDESTRLVLASAGDMSASTSPIDARNRSAASMDLIPDSTATPRQCRVGSHNNGRDHVSCGRDVNSPQEHHTWSETNQTWDYDELFEDYTSHCADGFPVFVGESPAV